MRRALLASLAVLVTAAPAAAAAAEPPALKATTARTGYVTLKITGPPAVSAALSETTGGTATDLGVVQLDEDGRAKVAKAAAWACEPRERTFHADLGTAGAADATVRTPSCRKRFTLAVAPRHARAGAPLTVTVADRWRLGAVRLRACALGPVRRRTCQAVHIPAGQRTGRATFDAQAPGRWDVRVRVPGVRTITRRRDVRPAGGRLKVLATGDSMIQIVDGFLKARLSPDRLTSDARISTGLSKPQLLDWVEHARQQASRLRPDVTVMFIGANDGFGFGDVACCSKVWSREYAKRASRMMRSYERGGSGTIYWNLLPAPRSAAFLRVFRAVNRGLRLAAREHRRAVRLIDLPATFTPGYRFRQSITWKGRTVSVRQRDGVHLNVAGASIAAQLIARELRRDGLRR